MSLDPLKGRLDANLFPPLDLAQDGLNEVLILDRFTKGRAPIVATPGDIPFGDAVNGVAAVGEDADLAM
jgi:hypothetical protein